MADAQKKINETTAAFQRLNVAARTAISEETGSGNQISRYNKIANALNRSRSLLRDTAVASGEWRVSQQKIMSQSERINDSLMRQKLSISDIVRNYKGVGAAMRQQMRLQQSLVTSYGTDQEGRVVADLFTPTGLDKNLRNARMQYGYINQMIGSIAGRTIDWGKNTQWAGRQIMVAVGIPLGLAATAAGALAYQVDTELTRIAKVYDTTATDQIGREREIQQVRETSMRQAMRLAEQYGSSVKDSLDIQAQLAATGLSGQNLLGASSEVVRIGALGEIDMQTSVDMAVSLQTAFRLSNEELTETFNLMNSLENATSLSINDFAEAIPRAASALSGLGVTTSEMGVLLVSMKESGIDATEGANALKSATTRLLNPTARAVKQFEAMNINVKDIVQNAGGNLFEVLKQLSVEMEGIPALEAQQAIASLFGTYQFNRLNASLQNLAIGMGLVEGKTNQTSEAFKIINQDAGQWADTALRETMRMQNSVSGQFKRMFESIKANLALLGEPVLAAVLPIAKFVNALLEGFNALSPFMQKVILLGGAFAMLLGPAIMMTGVFANMFGQIVKSASSFANLFLKFKIMNSEQFAAASLARTAAGAFDQEASSVARLTMAMQQQTETMARAQGLSMRLPGGGTIINGRDVKDYGGKAGLRFADGGFMSAKDKAEHARLNTVTASANENTKKLRINAGGAANALGTAGIAASILSASMGDADSKAGYFVQTLGTAAFALSLFPTALGKIGNALSSATQKSGGLVGGLKGGMAGIGRVIGTLVTSGLKFWGPVGLLASGILLFVKINSHFRENIRNQEELNRLGQDWADILGYTYNLGAIGGDVETVDVTVESIKKLKEANNAYVDSLRDAGDAEAVAALARREAMRIMTTGGTQEQAVMQMEMSFKIAGYNESTAQQFINQFTRELPSADSGELQTVMSSYWQEQIDASLGTTFDKIDAGNWWERLFQGDMSNQAQAEGKALAEYINLGMASSPSRQGALGILEGMEEEFDSRENTALAGYFEEGSVLAEKFGVTTKEQAEEMRAAMDNAMRADPTAVRFTFNGVSQSFDEANAALGNYNKGLADSRAIERFVAQEVARKNDVRGKDLDNIRTMDDLMKELYPNIVTNEEIMRQYAEAQRDAARAGQILSGDERKALLESIRMKNGLDKAGDAARGMGADAEAGADGVEELAEGMQSLELTAADYTNALKDAMTGATGAVFDEAGRLFAEKNEREISSLEAAGDRRVSALEAEREAASAAYDARMDQLKKDNENELKAFDDRWETALDRHSDGWEDRLENEEKVYDARLEAIQAQIDAEEAAEEKRQEFFDNEIERIKRLAESANRNIDINVALNTGDVDQAAKLTNDGMAAETTYGLEDARDQLSKLSEARVDNLENSLETIGKEKDARLKALEEVREAETKARNEQRDAEREALQERTKASEDLLAKQRDSATKAKDAAIESERQRTSAAVTARKAEQDANQRALDAELAALREHIPTNQAEYNAHVKNLEEIYRKYGINLSTEARGWNNTVTTEFVNSGQRAATSLQNEIDWRAVGNKIVSDMAGTVGLNSGQMLNFLMTGKWPDNPGANGMRSLAAGGATYQHVGGPAGLPSSKERTGVPRSASQYPSEYLTTLKQGEYVLNSHAVRTYGMDAINAINDRKVAPTFFHTGGTPFAPTGMGAAIGSRALADTMRMGLLRGLLMAMTEQSMVLPHGGPTGTGGGPTGTGEGAGGSVNAPAASGGVSALLSFGRMLRQRGFSVGENKALGDNPRPGAHSSTGYHYKFDNSGAIDVNAGAGESTAEKRRLAPIVQEAIRKGFGARFLSSGHYNHAHFDVGSSRSVGNLQPYLPSLRAGGTIMHDNTLVNTHKGETVLTSPLTRAFERGVEEFGSGGGMTVNFNNPVVREEADLRAMTKIVETALDKIETKNGRNRRIGR